MSWKLSASAVAAVAIVAGLSSQPAWSQSSGVKVGVLTCDVASGWGIVFGSTRGLRCTYSDSNNRIEHYSGNIDKFGVDIGYQAAGIIAWAVFAPTANVGPGSLAGNYVGATAGAAIGPGASANILLGGSNKTISLQPVSVEGMTGINLAAGIAGMKLTRAR